MINIITKTGATPENNVNLAVGSPFMRQETGTSAGSLSNSVTYRADYQNEYDSGYRSSSSQTSNHLGLTFTKTYSDGSVSLDLLGLRQFIDFPGALTQAEEQQDRSQAGDYVSTYFANTGLAALDWQQQYNAGWHSDTALSYRTQAASVFGGTDNQNYGTAQLNPQVYGKFTLWQRPIGVNLGMLLSNETYDYTGSIQDANQQQFGLNAGLSIPISPKLTGSVDARTVAVDTAGTFINTGSYPYQFNPPSSQTQHINLLSLGLEDQLNAATQVYLRRAMGYQLPFIDESSNSPYPSTGFGLQATTSTEYETGVNWQGARLKLTAEAFINELNNEIGYYSPNNNPYGGYNYNMDPTEREGVSLDGQYQASLQWTLGASGTLMNNRFRAGPDAGNQIPGSSNLLANVNARYQFNPIWSVYTEAQYTGAQYAEGDNANVSSEMPGYWLLNAALNAEFNAWLWNFRIDNITNTQYNLATVYFTTTNSVGYYPAPGRSYLLSVNYKFH